VKLSQRNGKPAGMGWGWRLRLPSLTDVSLRGEKTAPAAAFVEKMTSFLRICTVGKGFIA